MPRLVPIANRRPRSLDEQRISHPDEGAGVVVEELEDVGAGDPEDLAVRLRLECQPARRVAKRADVGERRAMRKRGGGGADDVGRGGLWCG